MFPKALLYALHVQLPAAVLLTMGLIFSSKIGSVPEFNATSIHCLTIWEPCLLGFADIPLDMLHPSGSHWPALKTNPAAR